MTVIIIISLLCGALAGYFFTAEGFVLMEAANNFITASDTILIVGLSLLLFMVGIDIGLEGTVVEKFKTVGWRILVFPLAVMVGTLAAAAVAALFLPIEVHESLAVGSGFGWYSLAPVILAEYSAELSAVSLLHNVIREVIAIICIPLVAKRIGYVETISLPGAAAMDVCLPIVEKATSSDIAVYSFVSGVIVSASVPILVPLFMSF